MKSDSIPSAVRHTRRTFELQALAALAGLVTAASAPARVRRARRPMPAPAPCLFIPPREKYPGQARAYLAGASRPMTDDEINRHNGEVDRRKAERRAERARRAAA